MAATNPIPYNSTSVAAGKSLYQAECLACHGAAGKGDGPDAADLEIIVEDLTSASIQSQSDGSLYWKTTLGRRPMPSYKKLLTDEERWHIVNYMRYLAGKPE